MVDARRELATALQNIQAYDQAQDYDLRYDWVLIALELARASGYAAGLRIDPTEPEWPVVYIELPTGQVSWHMPQHPIPWDGHDTATKYDRCRAFCKVTV